MIVCIALQTCQTVVGRLRDDAVISVNARTKWTTNVTSAHCIIHFFVSIHAMLCFSRDMKHTSACINYEWTVLCSRFFAKIAYTKDAIWRLFCAIRMRTMTPTFQLDCAISHINSIQRVAANPRTSAKSNIFSISIDARIPCTANPFKIINGSATIMIFIFTLDFITHQQRAQYTTKTVLLLLWLLFLLLLSW